MSKKNYAVLLHSFIFRKTWAEILALLPDEDAGKLIKGVFAHTRGESAQEYLANSPRLLPAASVIIQDIERNAKNFLARRGELPPEEEIGDNENA